jgi:Xaa-Pro dipeptidase
MITRRGLMGAAGAAVSVGAAPALATPATGLNSLAIDAQPISVSERSQRVAKAQDLMRQRGWGGLLVEAGSTLDYFTGVRWRRSERTTAVIIPATGAPIVVCPFFEEPSIRETLALGEVRTWNEADSPFDVLAGALRDRGGAGRPLAVEGTTRFFVLDGVRRAAGVDIVSGDPVVRACRLHKSPAELALMQTANDITLAALRHVHGAVETGMSSSDIAGLMDKTTAALGGEVEFSLVLLNEASAYPHGSHKPQTVGEGSVILIDSGCTLHGYQSDISRTWIHGAATPRQRQVWNTVKRGQEIALETAKPGVAVGTIDDAVRRYPSGEHRGAGVRALMA